MTSATVTEPVNAASRAARKSPAKSSLKGQMKGQQTRTAIVDAALGLATHVGLEGLSIGAVAEVMQMSKSGVFAHFGSREELQISVVREYRCSSLPWPACAACPACVRCLPTG